MFTRNNNSNRTASITTTAAVVALAGLAAPAAAQHFQRLDGTQDREVSYDVEQTRDAGYVTAGAVESVNPFTGAVDEDYYVIKHRKDGSVEWTTRYGGPARDRATSIHQTEDGGYIVAGHTESAGPGLGLGLMRLDPLGTVMWAYAYTADAFESVINPAEPEYFLQPAVRESRLTGEIAVVSNIRNAAGGQHPLYLRTDPAGFPIVNVSYIDPIRGSATFAGFTDIKELPDGTLATTGFVADADPVPDGGLPFVIDIDILGMRSAPDGSPFWVSRYDELPVQRSFEAGHGLDVSEDGDIYSIGAIAERDTIAGAPPLIGTDHLWLDAFTGAVVSTHYLDQTTPAYAATRLNRELCTVTSGIDLAGFGPVAGVGPGTGVLLMPLLGGVVWFNTYGPFSPLAQKLESVAITDMTCGFAFTGPKTVPVGFGGTDQLLVKTNQAGDSGCFQLPLDPREDHPEIQQIQMQFAGQFHDNWAAWGNQRSWDVNSNVLCFDDRCDPCKADFNGDGILDNADIAAFIGFFLGGDLAADCNGDGILDNADIAAFIAAFLAGC